MYESFFGLTGLPFQLNPDPSFLFHGKGHRDAFAALREGLAAGARVMVLTGEVGAGKTTLLQALLASVDPAATVTAHVSVSGLDAETLANRVLEALGLAPISDAGARLETLLARLRSGPLATLLVIDEAQHLDASAFELLEAIADAGATAAVRVQICLVGQPELRFLINAAERGSFRELIDVDRHLRPLELTEIRLYVEHRLHRAGWTGRPEFEDAAFAELYIFTNGIPRRVNLLCNSLMLSAWLKRQERIDAPAVARAAAALRGDSPQGAPDLLEAASLEHPPTLTDAVERATAQDDRALTADESHPWSCPSCDTVNPTTLTECWKCNAARPSASGVVELPSDAALGPQAAAVPADEPVPATSDEPPQNDGTTQRQPLNARLARLVHQEDAGRRRRKTIVASVASMAVALAVVVYVIGRESSPASFSQSTLQDIVVRRPSASAPASGLASPPIADPAPAADASQESPSERSEATQQAGQIPMTSDAAPERLGAPASVPASSPMPSCSVAAAALGLCETERSPSTRRQ